MRFVAGRGAMAERLQRGGAVAEMLAAAWRIAIGKKLLPGRAIGKKLLAGAPCRAAGRECHGEEDGGTVAESHREDVAGRGAVAGRHGGASAERRRCGRDAGSSVANSYREETAARESHREEIGKNLKSTRKPHTELLVEEGEEDSILFCNFGGKM